MKNIVKIGALALTLTFGFSSCNDYFDSIPGEWYDMDKTFSNRSKAIEFLNNVYSYVDVYKRQVLYGWRKKLATARYANLILSLFCRARLFAW